MISASWFSPAISRMSRQMLSASHGSFSRRYRSAFRSAAGIPSREGVLRVYSGSLLAWCAARPPATPPADERPQRIVHLVHHPLLQGDDRVVRDCDLLGADP